MLRALPVPIAESVATDSLAPALTPHGRLHLAPAEDAIPLEPALRERLRAAFERGSGHGLLQLGAGEIGRALPPLLGFWREFAARYVTAVCARPDTESPRPHDCIPAPPAEDLQALALAVPPMTGAEYATAERLADLWGEIDDAFRVQREESGLSIQDFLKRLNPAWNLVGRVHFNLAENRSDPEAPFAFLATYTSRLSAQAKAQHVPLGQALQEYAGAARKERLLSLLVPVQRAAAGCAWLKKMVDGGEIFHPLRWTPQDAFCLLTDLPALEAAGVVVRVPAGWGGKRPPRPQVRATIGGNQPSLLGTDTLLDFRTDVVLDGRPLTSEEIVALLSTTDGLALVRGKWVEIDRDKLHGMLEHFGRVERAAEEGGLAFGEAMRLLAGADVGGAQADAPADPGWTRVVPGDWLGEVLRGLRGPEGLERVDPGPAFRGTLRPYQQVGVQWLHLLTRLGLGACLADDMGLGKTIQVLALLLALRAAGERKPRASLLAAPASLLANWAQEVARFAPDLRILIAHPSATPAEDLAALGPKKLGDYDLVITTYGALLRQPALYAQSVDALRDQLQAVDGMKRRGRRRSWSSRSSARPPARSRPSSAGSSAAPD